MAFSFRPLGTLRSYLCGQGPNAIFSRSKRMYLPPETWGPFFWHTIHIVALGYPSNPTLAHKKAAKEFFESLKLLIPCPICRDHYVAHVEKFPITPHLDRRSDLFRWTVLLHNEVNTMLKKRTYTEAEALAYYKRLGARERSPVWTPDDFAEADWKARIQGISIGAGLACLGIGAIWWLQKND